MFIHINDDLVTPTDSYFNNLVEIYNTNFSKLSTVLKRQYRSHLVLQRSKFAYYREMYKAHQLEKNIGKSKGIFSGKTNTADSSKENIIKMKARASNYEQVYLYEIARYNRSIVNDNKEYIDVNKIFRQQEEDRIFFIKAIIDKYKNIYTEYKMLLDDYLHTINKLMSNENMQKELSNMNDAYCKNIIKVDGDTPHEVRFIDAQFKSYESFYHTNKDNIITELHLDPKTQQPQDLITLPITQLTQQEQDELIKQTVVSLLKDNDIELSHIAKFIEIMEQTPSESLFMKRFLDYILAQKKGLSIKFANLNNLKHLSNILTYITLSQESISSGQFELNFKIIYLAERVFHQTMLENGATTKTYLSALLSRNKYYRSKCFWMDIIELKLANKLQDHIKRLKKVNLPEEQTQKKGGFLSKLGDKLGFVNEIKKQSLVYNTRIKLLVKNLDQLDNSKIPILDQITTTEMCDVIRDSIPAFSSFNFPSEEALDMIAEITDRYKIQKDYINFYVTYYTVSTNTIRRALPNEMNASTIRVNKYKNTKKEDVLYKVLSFSLKYMNNKDYINVLLMNKELNTRLSKKIYKFVLKNPKVDNKTRLGIWGHVLKIKELKSKYNYKQLRDTLIEDESNKKLHIEIKNDVLRTYMGQVDDIEVERNKLNNILKVISSVNEEYRYCQGMNYLGEVILELIPDEEEAFYFFLGFFEYTEYPLIFGKDFNKLKIFFYVFKRLISLFEPELSSYFNSNGIEVRFFLPPWFVTLFLSSRQNNKTKELPIVLIRILDNFIVSGWKELMKVGIKLLNMYEKEVMKLRIEEMMQFLINDLLKFDFFHNKNVNNIELCFETTNIKKKLIKNIEDEYIQEGKISPKDD